MGGWKNFLFTQKYFGRLLQKHQIYFVGYSVIRSKFKGLLKNFLLVFSFPMLWSLNPIRPGGGGGAQRPGWPNSELTIRNLLLYDAETWWLLVFILKAHSDQILAKLINQGGCCCSFVIETSQKFWKWKNFPLLENCWNWHGGSILGREERFWT